MQKCRKTHIFECLGKISNFYKFCAIAQNGYFSTFGCHKIFINVKVSLKIAIIWPTKPQSYIFHSFEQFDYFFYIFVFSGTENGSKFLQKWNFFQKFSKNIDLTIFGHLSLREFFYEIWKLFKFFSKNAVFRRPKIYEGNFLKFKFLSKLVIIPSHITKMQKTAF